MGNNNSKINITKNIVAKKIVVKKIVAKKSTQKKTPPPPSTVTMPVYMAFVNAWLTVPSQPMPGHHRMPLCEQTTLFLDQIAAPIPNYAQIEKLVRAFQSSVMESKVTFGGQAPPSTKATNPACGVYDPSTSCLCKGLFPIPFDTDLDAILDRTECQNIQQTINGLSYAVHYGEEWPHTSIFKTDHLKQAVEELVMANGDVMLPPRKCDGEIFKGTIKALDRHPSDITDSIPSVNKRLHALPENMKACTDAKTYLIDATAPTDPKLEVLVRALADASNDILMTKYCQQDKDTANLMWNTGAAAVAFLKLCVLAGLFPESIFNNLMASILHFRVIGWYQDHAKYRLPKGLYGSRMTNITANRYVDMGLFFAVASASLTTGAEINQAEYTALAEACALINDLFDFRNDASKNKRENIVLRGIRGYSLCRYLDLQIIQCIETVSRVIRVNKTCALVVMAFANWMVLSSHHKIYELTLPTAMADLTRVPCAYQCMEDPRVYNRFLESLEEFGTLGNAAPKITETRAWLDLGYSSCRTNQKQKEAWLADITRSLLEPRKMRRVVDVVHYQLVEDDSGAKNKDMEEPEYRVW